MYQVFDPIVLSRVDIVPEGFNRSLVGAFRGAICFWVEGRGPMEVDIEFLEQLLPESTHE